MGDHSQVHAVTTFEGLDLHCQMQIDRYCDLYQRERREGKQTSLAQYLNRLDDTAAKTVLLRELLAIEVEVRSSSGEKLTVETARDLVPTRVIENQDELIASIVAEYPQPQTGPASATRSATKRQGKYVAHYELLEHIGSGAFGDVWKAHDQKLDRLVAIKMPRRHVLGRPELERFNKEAQVAARLRHPHIVSVHEIGQYEGQSYLVSDLIEGVSLDVWYKTQSPSFARIAAISHLIALALRHAHEAGIVHRDLKPTNILVDARDQPFMTDFGLAKALTDETTTVAGNLIGSPAYMSPEQARGHAHCTDQRADIYSFGVILYELLVNERPFRGSPEAVLHQVVHSDPPQPRKIDPSVPVDLDTICQKCLGKEPEARYQSAEELAEDLRRFLAGEPIIARPLSAAGRAWKWAKRNSAVALTSGIALAAVLFLAIAGPLVALQRARDVHDKNRWIYVADMIVAQAALQNANLNRTRQILDKYVTQPTLHGWRSFEWYYLRDQVRKTEERRVVLGESMRQLSVSPDGQYLAVVGDSINILKRTDRTVIWRQDKKSQCVAFHPDSRSVATAGPDGVRIYDVATGRLRQQLKQMQGDWSLNYSADGNYLAACGMGSDEVAVWDLRREAKMVLQAAGMYFYDLQFSPAGNRLAAASFDGAPGRSKTLDGAVAVWELRESRRHVRHVFPVDEYWARQVAFSPDGATIAVSTNKDIRVLDVATGRTQTVLPSVGAESLAYSPNGQQLACGSWTGSVTVWSTDDGSEIAGLVGHSSLVHSLTYSPEGQLMSVGYVTGEVIDWGIPQANSNLLTSHDTPLASVAITPDGRLAASVGNDGLVVITDTGTGECLRKSVPQRKEKPLTHVPGVDISADGKLLAIIDGDAVEIQELVSGRSVFRRERDGAGKNDNAFAPRGYTLATCDTAGKVEVWNPIADTVVTAQLERATCIEFSPDGTKIAVGGGTSIVCLDASTLQILFRCQGHRSKVYGIAFSPDSALLASASRDSTIRLWRGDSGEFVDMLPEQGNFVLSLDFSHDGKTLASGSVNRVKLWNVETREETITLSSHLGVVHDVKFSGNDEVFLATSFDKTVRLWRAPRGVD